MDSRGLTQEAAHDDADIGLRQRISEVMAQGKEWLNGSPKGGYGAG